MRTIDAGDPAVNSTPWVLSTDPTLAFTVAEPIEVDETRVAVAFPFVTIPVLVTCPDVVENCTSVPSFTLLPLISFTMAVIVEVDRPLASIAVGLTVTVIDDAGPGMKVTWAVETALPASALIVAVPAEVEDVRTVSATPFVTTAPLISPSVVVKLISVPSSTLLPFASLTTAEMVEVEVPSATILVGFDDNTREAVGPGMNSTS